MRRAGLILASAAAGLAAVAIGTAGIAQAPPSPGALRSASAFSGIADDRDRALALFAEAGKVMASPRCVNCHPGSDRPTQTDRMRAHQPLVIGGRDGLGAPGQRCSACHREGNSQASGVPGHPRWRLAPVGAAIGGRTPGQICEQIRDPRRNGGLSLEALIHHMGEDTLAGWAWHPGANRTPAPGTQAEFAGLIRAWVAAGAACPPA